MPPRKRVTVPHTDECGKPRMESYEVSGRKVTRCKECGAQTVG